MIDVRQHVETNGCTVYGQQTDRAEVVTVRAMSVHVHWCDWCWRKWACDWRLEQAAKYPEAAADLGVVS